jgi:signal transduction histidine kinase
MVNDTSRGRAIRKQPFLLLIGLVAIVVAVMSVGDMFSQKPNDGGIWLLGHSEVKIVDVVSGGPADRAGLKKGDVILGIANQIVTTPVEAAKVLIRQKIGSAVPYLIHRGDAVSIHDLVLETYRTADFQYGYYCFLGVIFFLVGLYVFLKKPGERVVQIFYLMCLTFMLFLVCNLRRSSYYWIDLFVQNAGALSLFLLPALFLHFFLIFPHRKNILSRHPSLLYIIYALPPVLHARFTLHQLFGLGRPFEALGVNFINWSLLGVYLMLGIVSLIHSFVCSQNPVSKRQIKMIFWGTTVGLVPFLIFGVIFVSIFHNTNSLFLGVLPMLLIPLSFGYSIIRYHLMDIDVIIKRSIVYTVLTGFVLGVYILLVNVIGGFLQKVTGIDSFVVVFLSVIVIAILFAPAREKIQQFIDRTFYRGEYDLHQTLETLTEEMNAIAEWNPLLTFIFEKTCSIMNVRQAVLLDRPTESKFFQVADVVGLQKDSCGGVHFEYQDMAALWDRREHWPITSDEIQDSPIFQVYSSELKIRGFRVPASLWVPLVTHGDIIGIMVLGEKSSGDIYSSVDREWLSHFVRRAALAIQNVKLMESIATTKERLFHTEKLASLGQLASGVAHEIRNPLSAIKMNVQSLSRQVNTTLLTKRRFEIALSEVDRLEKLVQGVLTFARTSPLNLERLDIHTVLNDTLKVLEENIHSQNIEIQKNYSRTLPLITVDRDKLLQVFLNLCLNAVQALKDGGRIEITTDVSIPGDGKYVTISISDSGPGIAREAMKDIFNPFFTTRAEGTGLGLTNVLKFVEQHDGRIEVESEKGHGTIFTVLLPYDGMKEVRT